MNAKSKSFLLLVITLFVGILFGFLLKTKIIDDRFEQMRGMRKPDGMLNMMIDRIEPNQEQLKELKPILEKHQKNFDAVMFESQGKIKLLIDSLDEDLSKIITKEQLERLHEHLPPRGPRSERREPPFFGEINAQRNFDTDSQIKFLKEKLQLNEKQEEVIKTILLESQKEFQSLMKKSNGDRMSMMEEAPKLKEDIDKKIMNQLNEEQKIEYKKFNEKKMKKHMNRLPPSEL